MRDNLGQIVGSFCVMFTIGLLAGYMLQRFEDGYSHDREAARIMEALAIESGASVGDVWAGTGSWTIRLAQRVGAAGSVFATAGGSVRGSRAASVLVEEAERITRAAAMAGVPNVSVATAPGERTSLPVGCCDAVLVREVFHHFPDPDLMVVSLFEAVKPGGRIAVIEHDVQSPEYLGGHGFSSDALITMFARHGFELAQHDRDWPGHAYCAVFQKPSQTSPRRFGSQAVLVNLAFDERADLPGEL